MNYSLELQAMKNTILHPTDFSPVSKNALEHAIMLAKTLQCDLEIVHSFDFSGKLNVEQNALTLISFTKKVEFETYKKINALQKLCKDKGVACITSTHTGKVSTWLPEYIAEREPMMVVMGTNVSPSIANKVFGSNTYAIIKNSVSPVLAVPESAKVKEFKHLIHSTDYKERDVEVIQLLMKLAMPTSAIIDIVHVLNAESAKDTKNHQQLHELKTRVEQVENYSKVNYSLLKSEDTEQQLRLLSKEKRPDILTLITSKKSFIKGLFSQNIAAKMVHKSEVPLLVFSV